MNIPTDMYMVRATCTVCDRYFDEDSQGYSDNINGINYQFCSEECLKHWEEVYEEE